MARQNASSIVGGAGFVSGLIVDLVNEVKRLGGTDEDLYRLVRPEGRDRIVQIAGIIIGKTDVVKSAQWSTTTYPLLVNYDEEVEELTEAGNYDFSDSDISGDHFPTTRTGQSELEAILVCFDKTIDSYQVLEELEKMELRAGGNHELLHFGIQYPEVQCQHPVVALEQVWLNRNGCRFITYLGRCHQERRLALSWFSRNWDDYYWFLAFHK